MVNIVLYAIGNNTEGPSNQSSEAPIVTVSHTKIRLLKFNLSHEFNNNCSRHNNPTKNKTNNG